MNCIPLKRNGEFKFQVGAVLRFSVWIFAEPAEKLHPVKPEAHDLRFHAHLQTAIISQIVSVSVAIGQAERRGGAPLAAELEVMKGQHSGIGIFDPDFFILQNVHHFLILFFYLANP
ncbi:MAG: hypothetical protein HPZ91_04795 [Lentisphaeria bacterium]|nr:hypothetical protein [Lentisphaeria bacterium]